MVESVPLSTPGFVTSLESLVQKVIKAVKRALLVLSYILKFARLLSITVRVRRETV